MIEHEIIKDICTLNETGTTCKKLTLTSWNGKEPKYDVRTWRTGKDGELLPGKGITLDQTEAAQLARSLIEVLQE